MTVRQDSTRHDGPRDGPRSPRVPVELTEAAWGRVRGLLEGRCPEAGVRVSLDPGGCSGLVYRIDVVDAPERTDEAIEGPGGRIFIDARAMLFIIGATVDLSHDRLREGFVFVNPNERGRCGCGESFFV